MPQIPSPGTTVTKRIFVDAEFTDFIECELISIALIADDGREFYGERMDFDKQICSTFVREAVLPQLGQFPDRVFSRAGLQYALREWLEQFNGGTFCVDFQGDLDLLVDLLDGMPDGWTAHLVRDQVDQANLESYFQRFGGRHHALHDARALYHALQSDTSPPPT